MKKTIIHTSFIGVVTVIILFSVDVLSSSPPSLGPILTQFCSHEEVDEELCSLLKNHTNNQLTEDHSHYFENATGSFGRIYEMGVDDFTHAFTPTNLGYKSYSAVGYGLANTILVTPTNGGGFVLIDSGSSTGEAEEVIAEFQRIGVLPQQGSLDLRAVIYTHNHIDHSGGSNEWMRRAANPPCDVQNDGVDGTYFARTNCVEVICQKKVTDAVINTATRTGQQIDTRSAYMYGFWSIGGAINNGIGPPELIQGAYFRPPSKTLTEYLDLRILGMQMWIQYVPSETNDEIIVFMPDATNSISSPDQNPNNLDGVMNASAPRIAPQELGPGLLFAAEAIQGPPTFPNLYSLRGTTFRNPLTWYQSVDVIRLYKSWGMIGSHGCPVMGYSHIQTVLINFRDAIQYVHDQTLRRIRVGYIPDELVTEVAHVPGYMLDNLASITPGLPADETPPLDPRDFLRTFYGSVPQSVRAIYAGYLGWNKGDPTYFHPLPPSDRADRYLSLFGGARNVLNAAKTYYESALTSGDKKDFQWVAEITSYVLSANSPCHFQRQEARSLKSKSLFRLAEQGSTNTTVLEKDYWSLNPNWRNWLVVGGQELAFHLKFKHAYPFGSALSGSGIQEAVPPRYWVQEWCWRFNSSNSALNGTMFGWVFLPNATRWGTATQKYILSVANQVVRLIDDPIEVNNTWSSVTYAVSTNHGAYSELLASDTSRHLNGTVDYMIFVNKFESLLDSGAMNSLSSRSNQEVAWFFHPTHFDPKPAFGPNIVERPVPVDPSDGACVEPPASDVPEKSGLSRLDDNCGGGCILTLILFLVLFGIGFIGLAVYVWKTPRPQWTEDREGLRTLQMA